MKLSFSTLGCPRMSFGDIQAIAKDLSYDGIEIRGVMHVIDAPDIREFSPEKREKTMARKWTMRWWRRIFRPSAVMPRRRAWKFWWKPTAYMPIQRGFAGSLML